MNTFLKSFLKCAGLGEVSTVAVFDGDKMLWGKRRDNSRYTNPGGHLDPGEDPKAGAKRELMEEAEYLPCLGRAVVEVDERKLIVCQTEAGDGLLLESVFENEDSRFLDGVAPSLKRFIACLPG